jgi:uncharacterized protein (DUF924 family)
MSNEYAQILDFWFEQTSPAQRWKKDAAFDALIVERFAELHGRAVRCELFVWRNTARGRLAEIILLDQFSRNMFRDSAEAFAHDALALALAQEAVAQGADQQLDAEQRSFLYMPYMHSESLLIHKQALELFTRNAFSNNLEFEIKHKAILERFGRYPHRNALLGRQSTEEERFFLQQPGSSF